MSFFKRGAIGGFTLIELLIVMAIIGLVVTIAIAGLATIRAKNRDSKRLADFSQIRKGLELALGQNNIYPQSDVSAGTGLMTLGDASHNVLCGLNNTVSFNSGGANCDSKKIYMAVAPADPTNTGNYVYKYITYGSATSYCFQTQLETSNYGYVAGWIIADPTGVKNSASGCTTAGSP